VKVPLPLAIDEVVAQMTSNFGAEQVTPSATRFSSERTRLTCDEWKSYETLSTVHLRLLDLQIFWMCSMATVGR
jgi:hypothetical protein